MRKLIYLILFLVIIVLIAVFLAFTGSGNKMILPYLNSYLENNTKGVKIRLTKLKLKPTKVTLAAKINESIDLVSKGKIDLIAQSFDLAYIMDTEEISTPTIHIKEHMKVKGKAVGRMDNARIVGKGFAFGSNIDYDFKLVKDTPQDISISMKRANLQSLLAVAGQKAYASGLLSIDIKIPKLNTTNPDGFGTIKIEKGAFNSSIIHKEFNVTLPKNSTFTVDIDAKTIKKHIALNGKIDTSLAKLIIDSGIYNVVTGNMHFDYKLSMEDMSKLKQLTSMDLQGEIIADGSFAKKKDTILVDGETASLGGETKFRYENDKLILNLKDADIAKILYKTSQPVYASGKLNAKITLDSVNNMRGSISASSTGELDTKLLRKLFDINLGQKFILNSALKAKLDGSLIASNLLAKSSMGNLRASNMQLDTSTGYISFDYIANIPKLERMQSLTTTKYRGRLDLAGRVKKVKELDIDGVAKGLGADIKFKLLDDTLTAHTENMPISKIAYMLDYPHVLEAVSVADLRYDIGTKEGKLDVVSTNAKILPSKLTEILDATLGIKLTEENFNNSKIEARLSKDFTHFKLNARSNQSYISINDGKITKPSDDIKAKLDMKLHGKDIQATIHGNIKHPRVSVDGSKYLTNKLKDKVMNHKEAKKLKKKVKLEGERLKEKLNSQLKEKHKQKLRGLLDKIF